MTAQTGHERHQPWGAPARFLDERTEPAEQDVDWTAGAIIYAHYRRWCFLNGFAARNKAALAQALRKRSQERVVNDITLFSLVLIVPAALEGSQARAARSEPQVNGEVLIKRDLKFVDGILPAGTTVPWMAANESEKADFETKRKRQQGGGDSAYSWLVVQWHGRRRRIPGDAAERL